MLNDLRSLDAKQRSAVLASYLGWTLDAFDFFIFAFVWKDVAKEFGSSIETLSWSLFLTLAVRPIGALIFGLAADKFGRRPVLMVDVILFSIFELASGFAPNLVTFFILRILFGIAMGGEWGVGASLTMETIPPKTRGMVSGMLQTGYPTGYLLASIVFGLLYSTIGWRGMFFVGAAPALLTLYIRSNVDESPVFKAMDSKAHKPSIVEVLRANAGRFLFAVALMTCFNFFSHGTQDLYPTFLREQMKFDPHTVSVILIVFNLGAIVGGLVVGAVSERIGRRKAIAAAALFSLLPLWFWSHGTTPLILAMGGFVMQVAVQGAWGVVPAYLNELSPGAVRGTFPGFAYQIGNLIAAVNGPLQTGLAHANGGNFSFGLALVAGIVAVVLAAFALFGPEARGTLFSGMKTEVREVVT